MFDQVDPLVKQAQEIAREYGRDVRAIYNWLKSHPIIVKNGRVYFKGINEISVGMNLKTINQYPQSSGGGFVKGEAKSYAIEKIFGKTVSTGLAFVETILSGPHLYSPSPQANFDMSFESASSMLINEMFVSRPYGNQPPIPQPQRFYTLYSVYRGN